MAILSSGDAEQALSNGAIVIGCGAAGVELVNENTIQALTR